MVYTKYIPFIRELQNNECNISYSNCPSLVFRQVTVLFIESYFFLNLELQIYNLLPVEQ